MLVTTKAASLNRSSARIAEQYGQAGRKDPRTNISYNRCQICAPKRVSTSTPHAIQLQADVAITAKLSMLVLKTRQPASLR